MRNIICTLAIALIIGCGGSRDGGGQLPTDWEQPTLGLGIVESQQPVHNDQPTMEELQAALALEFANLGIDPSKATSSAPSGSGVEVADLEIDYDLNDETQVMELILDWTERLAGDNDFNGEVNLSDLQPLVVYWEQEAMYRSFGLSRGLDGFPYYILRVNPESNAEFENENWVKCQIDTDNNGVINVSDVTGIARHFQQSLGGFNVYRRKAGEPAFTRLPNPNDPGAPVTLLRSQADQLDARPKRYTFIDPDQTPGVREYYVVATDAQGNEGEGDPYVLSCFINDTELDQPIGQFFINGNNFRFFPESRTIFFEPGTVIELDHSNSHAKEDDCTIVEYAYDIDGDGTDDYVVHDTNPVRVTTLGDGVSIIRLRVTDSNGLMDFFERPIFIGVNHPTRVNMQIDLGDGFVPSMVHFNSLGTYDIDTIIGTDFNFWANSDPGIVRNGSGATIREPGEYTCRMTVTDGFGNETNMEKEFSLAVGGFTNPTWRFAEVDGNAPGHVFSTRNIAGKPAVVFGSNSFEAAELYFKQALSPSGDQWGLRHPISTNMNAHIMLSPDLLDVDGTPIVAYFEGGIYGRAMFSNALSADGSSWSEPKMLTDVVMATPALGMSNGRPVIASGGPFGTHLFSALDPLGTSWGDPQPVEGHFGVVQGWVNVNGQEGFILGLNGNSLLLRPQDTDDPWNEPILLPDGFGEVFYPHAVCDGKLTFWNPGSSIIQQVQAQTADAKEWKEPTTIALPVNSNANYFDVLAIEGAPPWMCVYDKSRFELLVLQATDLQASSWGEPVVVTSYGDVGSGCKLVEVNGQPGIVYNDKSTNKLMIAVKE